MRINMQGYVPTQPEVVHEQDKVVLLQLGCVSCSLVTWPSNRCSVFRQDKTKTTLMMEDLSSALAEYGITSKKPEFYM